MSSLTNGVNGNDRVPYRVRYKAIFNGDRSQLETILLNLLAEINARHLDIDQLVQLNSIDNRYELAATLQGNPNLSLLTYWSIDSNSPIEITFDLDSPIPINSQIDDLFFEPAKRSLPTIRLVYNFLNKPQVTVRKSNHHRDIIKNQQWLTDHHQEYHGRWVAIRSGELVADATSAKELLDRVDSTENTLLTAVY